MSEEKPKDPAAEESSEALGLPLPMGNERVEVTLNRSKNELTIRDPNTGRVVTLSAIVEEEEPEDRDEEEEPLTPEEFSGALQRLDALGLTWTADRSPRVKTKDGTPESVLLSDEYEQIQAAYPTLPRELRVVVPYALTRNRSFVAAGLPTVGGEEYLESKAEIVRERLETPEYRSEFFFKQAIKIPYLETIDWEVVLKTHERNVETMPGAAYALLMLTLHNTNPRISGLDEHQTITVAANLHLVDKIIRLLLEVRVALEEAGKLATLADERLRFKRESDGGE